MTCSILGQEALAADATYARLAVMRAVGSGQNDNAPAEAGARRFQARVLFYAATVRRCSYKLRKVH